LDSDDEIYNPAESEHVDEAPDRDVSALVLDMMVRHVSAGLSLDDGMEAEDFREDAGLPEPPSIAAVESGELGARRLSAGARARLSAELDVEINHVAFNGSYVIRYASTKLPLGVVHTLNARSLKATCRHHGAGCTLFINSNNWEAGFTDLLRWVHKPAIEAVSAEQHQADAEAVRAKYRRPA